MANTQIAVINSSTAVADDDLQEVVSALQIQVHRDFAPAWGIDADLRLVPSGQKPPAKAWWLVILDDSDQAGALGYHDITSEGLPLGKVFAGSDLKYGYEWSVTASHELLEMLADPDINLSCLVEQGAGKGVLYAYEACDACEDDSFGYAIGGVTVSDFVYPSWFESFRKAGAQFDQRKLIKKPFGLLRGGYIGVYDITAGTGWQQLNAEALPRSMRLRPRVGSRRERRQTPRESWLISAPRFGRAAEVKAPRPLGEAAFLH